MLPWLWQDVWPQMLVLHAISLVLPSQPGPHLAPTWPLLPPSLFFIDFWLPSLPGLANFPDSAALHNAHYKCCFLGSHPNLVLGEGPGVF